MAKMLWPRVAAMKKPYTEGPDQQRGSKDGFNYINDLYCSIYFYITYSTFNSKRQGHVL